MSSPLNVIDVLLVEDDPGDALMTQEAFEHHKIRNQLHVVRDGVEALEFLRREGQYEDAPRTIPVVVLTTSEAEEDILRSYNLHANAYVTKPVDFDRFIEVVRQIDDFFVTVVKLPR
ncbi:response regulator [Saccharothrix sp. MB29]|nr:response regulator [Saccharothrix sp. MB29]